MAFQEVRVGGAPPTTAVFAESYFYHLAQKGSSRKRAALPSSASMSSRRLYLAMRSERETDPVLICPTPVATARSAMKVSSVSPERWEMTARYPGGLAPPGG